jgi:D-alanyl-D-alanine carboxypeptidase (penicillin-binding protein 5/6)
MNENAERLGMWDTHYDSPHGLNNPNNFSTAFDISILVDKCMQI